MSMVNRLALGLALLSGVVPFAAFAQPANYVVTCTAACVAADGTTQPAGTLLNRIVADPAQFNPGPGLALVPDTGQALYLANANLTSIAPEDFLNRFAAGEQQALMTAAASNWQISLWLTKATAAVYIDVSDPRTTAGMAALVTAGILTQARSTQILNLAVASP